MRISEAGFSLNSPDTSLHETLAYRAFNSAVQFMDKEVEKVRILVLDSGIFVNILHHFKRFYE